MTSLRWENAYSSLQPQIGADHVHKWPFDPSFPIDIRHFVFERQYFVEMNRHDYFEIVYVMSGSTDFKIGRRTFPVEEGDVVIVGPDLYHTNATRSRVGLACLYFAPQLILSSFRNLENAGYVAPFLRQGPNFPHVIYRNSGIPSAVLSDMERMCSLLPASSNLTKLSVRTYLKHVLVALLRHYSSCLDQSTAPNNKERCLERLQPSFELIENRSNERISILDAARACGMSKSRFMSFFKTSTGETFLSHLTNCRLSKAQDLLKNTNLPVSHIAQEVGFCDQSHFGFMFRKLNGVSPFAYRKLNRNRHESKQRH